MTRRILLASYEVPGLGGASTSAYALFRKMQRDRVDTHFVNLIAEWDVPYMQYMLGESYGNPNGLPDVQNCIVAGSLYGRHEPLVGLIERIGPDVMVGYGDIAAGLLKRAAPDVPVVFFAAGCEQMKFHLSRDRACSGVTMLDRPVGTAVASAVVEGRESGALRCADLIVAGSELTKALLERFFPYQHTCKLWPNAISNAEWIDEAVNALGAVAKPFAERGMDLLFVASSWSRVEKNLSMVKRIAARVPNARICIVGECAVHVQGATSYGFVGNARRVLDLMGDAKALVCPSLFDASPGVLFEGSAMGCNVVASKNCGNWMICHDELLVDPFTEDRFVEAVTRAIRTKYPDNMRCFLERGSYARLLEILAVL